MAFTLQLYDGTTTVDLSSSVMDYSPGSAPIGVEAVQETATVRMLAGLATTRTTVQSINLMFAQARRYQETRVAPKVWVYFKWDGGETTYRSEVLSGSNIADSDILSKAQSGNAVYVFDITWIRRNFWESTALTEVPFTAYNYANVTAGGFTAYTFPLYNSYIETIITAEVMAAGDDTTVYFTGTLANMPIKYTNSTTGDGLAITYTIGGVPYTVKSDSDGKINGTSISAGLFNFITGGWTILFTAPPNSATNITGDYRVGYGNWAEISSSDVTGDLPAPAKITLTNINDTANAWDELWIGHTHTALSFGNTLQGEDSTSSTSVADTSCSGNLRGDYDLADTAEHDMFTWAQNATQITAGKGGLYRVLARFAGDTSVGTPPVPEDIVNVKFRLKLLNIWEGEQVNYLSAGDNRIVRDLGVIQIPPWPLPGGGDTSTEVMSGMYFAIAGQAISATRLVSLDYVVLLPLDSFRKSEWINDPDDTWKLVINGPEGAAYMESIATGELMITDIGFGDIILWPGKWQRIYIMSSMSANWTAKHDFAQLMTIHYRPRRVVI